MRFRTTFTRKHVLGILVALSVLASVSGPRVAGPLRQVAGFLLPPVSDLPMYAVTQVQSRLSPRQGGLSAVEAEQLRRENDYLRRVSAYWRRYGEVYRRRSEDLSNFQRMYGPTVDLACELIPARILAAGALPYDQTRMVRGGGRKLRVGSPVTTRLLVTRRAKALPSRLAVVTSNFLVGRIVASGAFTARLQLITDPSFAIPVRIRRVIVPGQRRRWITVTGGELPRTAPLTAANNEPVDAIVRGTGTGRLVVRDVKEYHKIRPGDLLVASAAGGEMPTEVHIGKVVEVRRDPEDARRVTVLAEPHAPLAGLRNVYILSPIAPVGGS